MPHRKPVISRDDQQRIQRILDDRTTRFIADTSGILALQSRLDTALVVTGDRVLPTVVKLGCVVQLSDVSTEDVEVFTLVEPEHADIVSGKLSVLAPLGVALLGCHAGQTVRVRVPSGQRSVRIDAVNGNRHRVTTSPNADTVAPA